MNYPKRWPVKDVQSIKNGVLNEVYMGVTSAGEKVVLRRMKANRHKRQLFFDLMKYKMAGLVQVVDVEIEGENLWVLEAWIEGETLGRLLRGPLLEADMEEMILEALKIAIGLERLFVKSGILHLDIKPDNIMVDACGQWHLIDFASGISQVNKTNLRAICQEGTRTYMSPERFIEPNWVGSQTDLYALSMTLLQALSQHGGRAHRLIRYLSDWCERSVLSSDEQFYKNWRHGLCEALFLQE